MHHRWQACLFAAASLLAGWRSLGAQDPTGCHWELADLAANPADGADPPSAPREVAARRCPIAERILAVVARADSLRLAGQHAAARGVLSGLERRLERAPWPQLVAGDLEATAARSSGLARLAALLAEVADTTGALAALDRAQLLGVTDGLLDSLERGAGWRALRGFPGFERRLALERLRASTWSGARFALPWSDTLPLPERLAGLAVVWAEVRYGFAGLGDPPVDWDSLYLATIPAVIASADTRAYYRTLTAMVATLEDDHTSISLPRELRATRTGAPLTLRRIGGRVVVTEVRSPLLAEAGWRVGDEIVAVGGMSPAAFVAESIAPWNGNDTPQSVDIVQYGWRLTEGTRGVGRPFTVLTAAGDRQERLLVPGAGWDRVAAIPPVEQRRLSPTLGYLAANSFSAAAVAAQIDAALDSLTGVAGLVVDLRRNGGGSQDPGWRIIARLLEAPITLTEQYSAAHVPILRAWGLGPMMVRKPARTITPHPSAPWRIPVAWLIGPYTGSAAEGVTAAALQSGAVTTFGERTRGSTGQPLLVPLPGGGTLRVRVEEERMQDGTRYIGTGIAPMVPVPVTLEGLRAGRDEVLLAAVAWLREQLQ